MTSTLPQRVLIVRPSALGDVCRTVPLLASLRAALPEAAISWVVQDDFVAAIDAHPALNEVIAFPRNRFGRWWTHPSRAVELQRWLRGLRLRRFDAVIDAQGLSRSGLITRATRAPVRVGWRQAREFAWLAYNRRVPESGGASLPVHAVDQMLSLLSPLGVTPLGDMRLYVAQQHRQWWREQRAARGFAADGQYAVIAPGSRWLSKRWPMERFAELVEPLVRRGFERVVLVGSPAEREQARWLLDRFGFPDSHAASSVGAHLHETARDNNPVSDFVGGTSIGQMMAIIENAGLVIANDSAPLHMAVGFDRPCIALYGPTDPAAVGPYRRAECVVRAYQPNNANPPNFKDPRLGDSLMRLISTAMALQAVDRVLALWPRRQRFLQQGGEDETVPGAAASPRATKDAPEIRVTRGLKPETAA